MAAGGGYNAPNLTDTATSFGSDSVSSQDPASSERNGGGGGLSSQPLFGVDFKRHEDLKQMLDSNKDGQKLDAMKLIIGMIAKGKDCTDLFPAVVKNVVSKNSEIKKLVYVYLVRYAEEQQDLALLSISTFQKALKDPNQLIRGSALRVLSSIRVPIIAPIMMLSIKESVTDMSPYVRKTAANAIPKLYSLDPEQKDQLVEVIEKLLKDQTTLVAGSVVMAFETVCPERIDLIHKNYRKLCNLLVDVDEWGQVMILQMLTRYARSQFLDPNQQQEEGDAAFYSDEDKDSESASEDEDDDDDEEVEKKKKKKSKKKPYVMDPDHRLLLRNSKPLLQSRSAAVVMAVAQLYHHVAPSNEVNVIAKPLIRLLKSHSEIQNIVLSNVATLSAGRPNMFEPYLKSFYVHSSDHTNIKLLKLDIIANIAGETSIHSILREFRTYIASSDKVFVAATIQAIGRVACSISEVTETCLHGLMSLLNHKNEDVVGESVVVIKKLLQLHPKENKDLIVQVAKLADSVTVPLAKGSILWLVGEYCSLVPKIAPDVLRKAAKTFSDEEDIVKLQTINLAAKLHIANAKQSKLLCQYVMNLAKYDLNYDIRDRARFLRQLVLPEEESALSKYAKKILLASKPAPVLESMYKDRSQWQLGSLTHAINAEASGYVPLPDFPEEAPDKSVRDVEDAWGATGSGALSRKKKKSEGGFYDSEDESSEGSDFYSSISGTDESGTEDSESGSEEESGSGSGEEDEEEEEEESESEETSSDEGDTLQNLQKRFGVAPTKKKRVSSDSETSGTEDSEEDSTSEEEESSSEEDAPPAKPQSKATSAKSSAAKKSQSKKKDDDLAVKPKESSLLDLDDWGAIPAASSTSATMATNDLLTPMSAGLEGLSLSDGPKTAPTTFQMAEPSYIPKKNYELLNRIKGDGLQIHYRFTRRPHIYSAKLVGVELTAQNTVDTPIGSVSVGDTRLQSGMSLKETGGLSGLAPGATANFSIGIDFNDTQQPAKFDICIASGKKYAVQVDPVVGELVRPIFLTESEFKALQNKLTGMHETSGKLAASSDTDPASARASILEVANVSQVSTSNPEVLMFAGVTFSSGLPLLITVKLGSKVTINSEKMVINGMLLKVVQTALTT